MKRIEFNTPASNRALARACSLIKGAWSVAAALGSKSRSVQGYIEDDKETEITARLKALKCTSIKTEEVPNDHFKI